MIEEGCSDLVLYVLLISVLRGGLISDEIEGRDRVDGGLSGLVVGDYVVIGNECLLNNVLLVKRGVII